MDMKRIKWIGVGILALGTCGGMVLAQAPVITSFSRDGKLVCGNLLAGSTATVEWASSLAGPWTNNWAGLDAVKVNSNGVLQANVPMFYRVRGVIPSTNNVPAGMALIPAGAFTMGNAMDAAEGDSGELPLHTVTVSAYYMDATLASYGLWQQVYQWATNHGYGFDNIGAGKASNHPVQKVSWYDSVKWCNARSEMEGRIPAYYTGAALDTVYRTGQVAVQNDWVKWDQGYRLPTEAEWEKAARGGVTGKRFPWGDTIDWSYANYEGDWTGGAPTYAYDASSASGYNPAFNDGTYPYTSPVGSFAANAYGLYDMAGDVWGWCWDYYGAYASSAQSDPRGPATGSYRVYRGGAWNFTANYCRSSYRYGRWPDNGDNNDNGFRTVLPAGQ